MKQLKIMLLSFALLAVVGSALAFKARFGNKQLCTSITNGAAINICTVAAGVQEFCPNSVITTTDQLKTPVDVFCTTTPQDLDGDHQIDDCNIPGLATVRCLTTTTLYND